MLEATVDIGVGWCISIALNAVLLPLLGESISVGNNLIVCAAFTAVSLVRRYGTRRLMIWLGRG
jgi:hypothetical protein